MYVGGLDLARRSDFSALVVLDVKARKVVAAYRLAQGPYQDQITAVCPALQRLRLVAVDRGGVGDAVLEMLPPASPVLPVLLTSGKAARQSRDGCFHIGKRALIELLLRSRVTVAEGAPGRADLQAELAAFQLRLGKAGRVRMEAGRGHDDLVIAAGLAVLAASMV